MHSSESLPPAPVTGPELLQQVGRLIIRARSPGTERRRTKTIQPSTSQQVSVSLQPKPEPRPAVEAQLESHVEALWTEQIPICIEVLLSPDCQECHTRLSRVESEASYDKSPSRRGMLLERWTLSVILKKNHESLSSISSQWMLSAVRSQLHFSQLAAWLARIAARPDRRRKSSRETCNFKKLEANCDSDDLKDETLNRKLNVIYSIKIPGESYKMSEFTRTPTDHTFPVTDIGNNAFLKVYLESLPRIEEIPTVKCMCNSQPKRRASKEMPANAHEEIASRMGDLTLGPPEARFKDVGVINSNIGFASGVTRRLSIFGNSSNEYFRVGTPEKDEILVDDRMHTPCSESGKHKCSCDDESDQGKENVALKQETKKLDERRLKEIAKYKRRLRKENKLRKLSSNSESTGNSEGEIPKKRDETHTSIPILQAARFDRLRAIGCYRNQTYLTLPASRIDTKSPFLTDNINIPTPEYKKTNTVSTQTDDLKCNCGSDFVPQCEACAPKATKHKCDNFSNSLMCDINSVVGNVRELVAGVKRDEDGVLIKRPKLKRFFPIVDRLERLMTDRFNNRQGKRDIEELHLKDDDTVFAGQSEMRTPLEKRKKNSSIGDEYVLLESCDYGTFDKCDGESPTVSSAGFDFETATDQGTDCHGKDCQGKDSHGKGCQGKDGTGKDSPGKDGPGKDNQVPSPTEMDRFRWRFDSAASMVFHNKTGLPLTSSPAPLKRGKNCFDYDASINGISGIKSALFQPAPTAPPPPRPAPPPRTEHHALLGSFEESALKGRLEPVATVHGFTAELAASGSFCPPHRRLPVTVFFYAPGGTNAPYMGHINLGSSGYRVPSSGTIQVSLFNPHGTLVKMFVVLYSLIGMPPSARTFLRQRTLYLPAGAPEPRRGDTHKYMRYLIHLRFMTSKSGKLYLHTDIRIIVSRKADMDTAAAHTPIHKPLPTNHSAGNTGKEPPANQSAQNPGRSTNGTPCRVFGGSSDYKDYEIGYDSGSGVSYELRSFTYGPENPKYSPR